MQPFLFASHYLSLNFGSNRFLLSSAHNAVFFVFIKSKCEVVHKFSIIHDMRIGSSQAFGTDGICGINEAGGNVWNLVLMSWHS